MHKSIDFARMTYMDAWLRHPVLGDPSFDTFQRLGDAVYRSEEPFEWAVNCSIYRDFDDTWYYYAGLYGRGYIGTQPARFRIFRSADRGASWEDLGWGFETGFRFEGDPVASDVCPDAVIFYDEKRKKYLLTYDTATNAPLWEAAPTEDFSLIDGAALAWADTPAGPFQRLKSRFVTSQSAAKVCGRFRRCYASTVIPREKDYLALVLMDSGRYYAWGIAAMTAPTPEGPWSEPRIVLSCDWDGYFPCPLEFYPAEVHDGIVFCSATSVAKNRNYQAIFEAQLEQAHCKEAWHLTANGNVWHSQDHPDEHYGIWGQTYHGFVEPDTGRYVVAYPSKDQQDFGVMSVATRPWDLPHSDGFTMTAHGGPALSTLLTAYREFSLDASIAFSGTVDLAFAYSGVLGPDESSSDAVPSAVSMADYAAVRLQGNQCSVVSVSADGGVVVQTKKELSTPANRVRIDWFGDRLSVLVNGTALCEAVYMEQAAGKTAPLALILQPFSRIECDQFIVDGENAAYTLRYNATDALLGAGQWLPDHAMVDPEGKLAADIWHRIPGGYVGKGKVSAKWNVIGSSFTIPLKRSLHFGVAGIWLDGEYQGSVDLQGLGEACFRTKIVEMGPHAIRIAPLRGRITITGLLVNGNAI